MQMISNPGFAGPRPQLKVETARLYSPVDAWAFSHHASITRFQGRYYAVWSNGHVDEDAPEQRVLLATSDDFVHWSEPRPLVEAWQGVHALVVLTASGFHQHAGVLVAYAGVYDYPPACFDGDVLISRGEHVGTGLYALTTRDGEHWSPPRDLDLPVVPNHPPQATASGRLIISGNIAFPYSDDPSGLSGLDHDRRLWPRDRRGVVRRSARPLDRARGDGLGAQPLRGFLATDGRRRIAHAAARHR